MPRLKVRPPYTFVCALLLAAAPAEGPALARRQGAADIAQEGAALPADTVSVRSMRGDVPVEVVQYIARNAEGRKLTREAYPDATSQTAESLAARFCGRVTDAYRAAFLEHNGRTAAEFSFTAPLNAADAYVLEWPACLEVSAHGGEYIVRQADNAADIYTELTGSAGGPDTRAAFFNRKALAKLSIGEKLNYPWQSVTTQLRPRKDIPGLDRSAFVEGLRDVVEARAAADKDVPLAYLRIDRELLRDKGDAIPRIVTAADVTDNGAIVPPQECVGQSPALSPAAVRAAFASAVADAPQTVRVLVVDNGFFAAKYAPETDSLSVSPRFTGYLARVSGPGRIGPNVRVGDDVTYTPILDPNVVAPDVISGHGTHVAGLVLGGTAFSDDRAFLANGPASSWLKLTVANVGNGERYLPSNAGDVLDLALGTPDVAPDIVNLSVVYTRRHAPRFSVIATSFTRTLFVVAAGNDHGESVLARELYPAALGGQRQANIITVASSRPDGRLASFSNVGETAVDIAADGCMLSSWIDFDGPPMALSGTSQSTPLVAFTAALIRAAAGGAVKPAAIKSRILVSGDLLKPGPDGRPPPIYSRSALNIAKALYLRRDYIRFTDRKTGEQVTALGQLSGARGGGCGEVTLNQFSAFKQDGALIVGFVRNDVGVDTPCQAVVHDGERVTFKIENYVGVDGRLTAASQAPRRIELADVQEFVLRMPGLD